MLGLPEFRDLYQVLLGGRHGLVAQHQRSWGNALPITARPQPRRTAARLREAFGEPWPIALDGVDAA